MGTQETKSKVEPDIGCLAQIIGSIFFGILFFTYMFFLNDVQTYTAPDVTLWSLAFMPLSVFFTYKLTHVIPKDKQGRLWAGCSFLAAFLLPLFFFPTLLWINYKWSDSETRHEELVMVKKHKSYSSGPDMIVRFESGYQRTVNIKDSYWEENEAGTTVSTGYWEKYEIGSTLPVTIERGLFGIDVIVKWGFENDEHTLFLPNYPEHNRNTEAGY